jgi:hypothetical protein
MLATLITRILQLIFAIIVLGLSVRAANWQEIGSIPTTTAYCAFAGAFAMLISIIGLAAIWLTAIPKMIMSGLDGLASIILLAGGIVRPPPSDRTYFITNFLLRHMRRKSQASTVALPFTTSTT